MHWREHMVDKISPFGRNDISCGPLPPLLVLSGDYLPVRPNAFSYF
jgi:acetyl esterase/lipase